MNCVFFAQHSVEKRPWELWEGRFFIAPKVPFANVHLATEGGIPVSRWSGKPIVPVARKVSRVAGSQGEVPSVLSHWADTEPSHDKQYFGGSR
jgi:hypothetical protein